MNKKSSKILGFTLVELMIVVVIASILVGIALPSYWNTVRKSRRSEATTNLSAIQLAEEKYRFNNVQYGTITDVWGGITTTTEGHYTLGITNLSATSYTLTANAQGDQANDKSGSTSCASMSIVYDSGAVTKTPTQCW